MDLIQGVESCILPQIFYLDVVNQGSVDRLMDTSFPREEKSKSTLTYRAQIRAAPSGYPESYSTGSKVMEISLRQFLTISPAGISKGLTSSNRLQGFSYSLETVKNTKVRIKRSLRSI